MSLGLRKKYSWCTLCRGFQVKFSSGWQCKFPGSPLNWVLPLKITFSCFPLICKWEISELIKCISINSGGSLGQICKWSFQKLSEPYEVFFLPPYLPAKRQLEGREKYIWNMAKRHLHPKDSRRSLCWGPRLHCGLRGISLAQGLCTLTSLSLGFTERAHELCFPRCR